MAGVKHSSSADGSFSGTGATNWNADHVVTGDIDMGGFGLTNTNIADTKIPFADSSKKLVTGNLSFASDRLTVGSGSAGSAGVRFGNVASGEAAFWHTNVAGSETAANSRLYLQNGATYVNVASGGSVGFAINGTPKVTQGPTAGAGPTVDMGTATTDVGTRLTQAWNNGAVAFTAWRLDVTSTAQAAGSKLFALTDDTNEMFSVSQAGVLASAGTAGATAGPYTTITSITVKGGLVTAIAGS